MRFFPDRGEVHFLDQRLLPADEKTLVCKTVDELVQAMREMVVRGAPAIGVSAAYGCCLAVREASGSVGETWRAVLPTLLDHLMNARPTAVNLAWAVNRLKGLWTGAMEHEELYAVWTQAALALHQEDIEANMAMGWHGAELLDDGDTVMTHCNAGALATGGYGTALGVIRAAVTKGKKITVVANETRPLLQGARLTAYELDKDRIPVRVACDNACSALMSKGLIHKVVVGADRIAANGDTANKIGTMGVAILAQHHGIPFYVAAPCSTLDPNTATGDGIDIEQRAIGEVRSCMGVPTAPVGVEAFNPAFDVTPAAFISAIVTERGILKAPFLKSIAVALGGGELR
ncbi:MAG: S-methyl-5-thioribose-1-phosphate isomerase [Deltaproteobacteria bacterium]|nr:S-methyl-5-thioribose-1-phosphate isomerase [Deltaproteobacteria bacterium]